MLYNQNTFFKFLPDNCLIKKMIKEDLETTETYSDLYFKFCQKKPNSDLCNTDRAVFPRHIGKFIRAMFFLAYFGFHVFVGLLTKRNMNVKVR